MHCIPTLHPIAKNLVIQCQLAGSVISILGTVHEFVDEVVDTHCLFGREEPVQVHGFESKQSEEEVKLGSGLMLERITTVIRELHRLSKNFCEMVGQPSRTCSAMDTKTIRAASTSVIFFFRLLKMPIARNRVQATAQTLPVKSSPFGPFSPGDGVLSFGTTPKVGREARGPVKF